MQLPEKGCGKRACCCCGSTCARDWWSGGADEAVTVRPRAAAANPTFAPRAGFTTAKGRWALSRGQEDLIRQKPAVEKKALLVVCVRACGKERDRERTRPRRNRRRRRRPWAACAKRRFYHSQRPRASLSRRLRVELAENGCGKEASLRCRVLRGRSAAASAASAALHHPPPFLFLLLPVKTDISSSKSLRNSHIRL